MQMSLDPKIHPDYPLARKFISEMEQRVAALPLTMAVGCVIVAGEDVLMLTQFPTREQLAQVLLGLLQSAQMTAKKNHDLDMFAAMAAIEEYAKVVLGMTVEGAEEVPLAGEMGKLN